MSDRPGSALEVLRTFLKLGVSSFGGPVAHIGYFRRELVMRRRWLDEAAFAELLGLCQVLPGPTSSQLGFSLGLLRAGYLGALSAWTGFTLPSAVALALFAFGARHMTGPIAVALTHGLQLVAVPIVAQAVTEMARALTPDARRIGIALTAALLVLVSRNALAQLGSMVLGAVLGLALCQGAHRWSAQPTMLHISSRVGALSLTVFLLLLLVCLLIPVFGGGGGAAVFAAFYRSGALVFGGGHVVLPLLRDAFVGPGWISDDAFLAGYGATQAIPGPLFSFAAYLGSAVNVTPHGPAGAALGLIAIFLPGMLLLVGVVPFCERMRRHPNAQALMRGINAAVVGVLAAALYQPIWRTSVNTTSDWLIALIGLALLMIWRTAPIIVVMFTVLVSIALSLR